MEIIPIGVTGNTVDSDSTISGPNPEWEAQNMSRSQRIGKVIPNHFKTAFDSQAGCNISFRMIYLKKLCKEVIMVDGTNMTGTDGNAGSWPAETAIDKAPVTKETLGKTGELDAVRGTAGGDGNIG